MNNTESRYPRVTITGTLTCKTDLHLGDGDIQNQEKIGKGKDRGKGKVNTVCIANDGNPYLPGSSLRGSLTAGLNRTKELKEFKEFIEQLFGDTSDDDENKRTSSKIQIADAYYQSSPTEADTLPYWNDGRKTWMRHGIAIDNITATADDGKFYRYELIPTGTKFGIKIQAKNLTIQEINFILELLKRWNSTSQSSLGKGKNKGYGKVQWQSEKQQVQVIDDAELKRWLESETEQKPPKYKELEKAVLDSPEAEITTEMQDCLNVITQVAQSIELIIKPQSPLLVHEPAYIKEDGNTEDNAKITYARKNGKPIIYASTLKGVARAHAHRIITTIAHVHYGADAKDAAKITEKLLENLFGNTQQRGNIYFNEASGEGKVHKQFFNAIDRFSGEVKDGALYNVEAVDCDRLTSKIYSYQKLEDTDKGILYFLVRDVLQGELSIGWGKSRGYGAVEIELTNDDIAIDNPQTLIDHIGKNKIENYLNALHKAIKKAAKEYYSQKKELNHE